ncbi:structure-specific endonuclease subunit SLX1 homolog isoform X1 [Musca domestica]|uniref:Structure-specific endonuclease subunit SLX1 homolog n=1 Tax=Musca domestica TaxID=7370 RepID=A0A905IX32_MUSDO|nr:structure-specific endonuclease subunit SLX1 homolog isoform X1 [Musca domestica]
MSADDNLKSRFFGVYLLCSHSLEKRYQGKCYIGFTVNPNRRIKQHNRGKDFGGAKKTSNKGPWKMVMIVHGFPNNISALQFEWAWQQPSLSSRLKVYPELKRKLPKETYFQYNFRILSRMLNTGPWNRLPLIVQWLEEDYECEFDILHSPPKHMQIRNGKIALEQKQRKKHQETQPRAVWAPECHLCMQPIHDVERSRIGCLNNLCKLTCHIICLANHMLSCDTKERGHYIPISGDCPLCETNLLWIDLLQRKRKMQGIQVEEEDDDDEDDEDDSDVEIISGDEVENLEDYVSSF